MANDIGAGTVEDRHRKAGRMENMVGLPEQACHAEREVVGVGAGQPDRFQTRKGDYAAGGEPVAHPIRRIAIERIKYTTLRQRRVDRTTAIGGFRPPHFHRIAHGVKRRGERAEPRGKQRLDTLAYGLCKTRRRAAGAYRDCYRRAIDNRRRGEVAKIGPIDDVDEQAARPERPRCSAGPIIIIERDEGDRCALFPFGDDSSARARDQPRLGIGSLPLPDQHDRAAVKVQEERKLFHVS